MRRVKPTLVQYACLTIVLSTMGSAYLNLHSFTLFRARLRSYAEATPGTVLSTAEFPRSLNSDYEHRHCDLDGISTVRIDYSALVPVVIKSPHSSRNVYDSTLARQHCNRGPPLSPAA